ncbi:hypothetical protein Tco_1554057 [Tanacetum coccineum]
MAEEQDEQQQNLLDAELGPINEQVKIGISNFRIALEKTRSNVIYKVCLEIPKYKCNTNKVFHNASKADNVFRVLLVLKLVLQLGSSVSLLIQEPL